MEHVLAKRKTERIRKIAQRTIGLELPSLGNIYVDRTLLKLTRIMKDPTHHLFHDYNLNEQEFASAFPALGGSASDVYLGRIRFMFTTEG